MLSLLMATSTFAQQRAADAPAPVPDRSANGEIASPQALHLLVKGIDSHRLVLLGEMHGTREIPALVGDLVESDARSGNPLMLALEIDSREQSRIDRYLASSGTDADRRLLLSGDHWQDPMHDGRDSDAMLTLIERVRGLRAAHGELWIVAFDRDGSGDRNARMASALRDAIAQRPTARMVVLTGNIHAMVRPADNLVLDGKPIPPLMTAGRLLSDLDPLSINITALGGESVICQQRTCDIRPYQGSRETSAPAFRSNGEKAPWNATLTLPRFTPSPAAIEVDTPQSAQ